MAVGYIDPDGETENTWSSGDYTHIDDGTRQPNVPPDDYIGDFGGGWKILTMTSIAGVGEVTSIRVWGYVSGDTPIGYDLVPCSFSVDGGSTWSDEKNLTSGEAGAAQWSSQEWVGSWTQEQLNNILIRVLGAPWDNEVRLWELYVEITYTPAVAAVGKTQVLIV